MAEDREYKISNNHRYYRSSNILRENACAARAHARIVDATAHREWQHFYKALTIIFVIIMVILRLWVLIKQPPTL